MVASTYTVRPIFMSSALAKNKIERNLQDIKICHSYVENCVGMALFTSVDGFVEVWVQ